MVVDLLLLIVKRERVFLLIALVHDLHYLIVDGGSAGVSFLVPSLHVDQSDFLPLVIYLTLLSLLVIELTDQGKNRINAFFELFFEVSNYIGDLLQVKEIQRVGHELKKVVFLLVGQFITKQEEGEELQELELKRDARLSLVEDCIELVGLVLKMVRHGAEQVEVVYLTPLGVFLA